MCVRLRQDALLVDAKVWHDLALNKICEELQANPNLHAHYTL